MPHSACQPAVRQLLIHPLTGRLRLVSCQKKPCTPFGCLAHWQWLTAYLHSQRCHWQVRHPPQTIDPLRKLWPSRLQAPRPSVQQQGQQLEDLNPSHISMLLSQSKGRHGYQAFLLVVLQAGLGLVSHGLFKLKPGLSGRQHRPGAQADCQYSLSSLGGVAIIHCSS